MSEEKTLTAESEQPEAPTDQPAGGEAGSREQGRPWKIFVAWAAEDVKEQRDQFAIMLEKAGFDVFPKAQQPEDEEEMLRIVQEAIMETDCSVHVLGGSYGHTLRSESLKSQPQVQYEMAARQSQRTNGDYKRLVWTYPLENNIVEGQQQEFITEIQNSISKDMMLTNASNPAQIVEDIRTFLEQSRETQEIPKEYDIAFIANVQDAGDCYQEIDELSKQLSVQTLTVVPEKDIDYRKEAADIIQKSRLVVVYFKEASDWAVSFVKQIWKKIGGLSTGIPFLLLGEEEPRRNRFIQFEAPQVVTKVVPHDQIVTTTQELFRQAAESGEISERRFCPYTGLRPFTENESIFFKGRESHIDTIIDSLREQRFSMVTGSSGDGKSSLIYAGVIPSLKGGFLKTSFSKWAVADFRPERSPLKNLSESVAKQLRIKNPDEVETTLSYGFSALVDLYKESDLYCDVTSSEWMEADEEQRKAMKRQAANLLIVVDQFEEFFTNTENFREGVASPVAQITVNVLLETIRIAREEELPIYVVFTMRSDYIGQCVAFRGFAEMIGLSTYFVPRLRREEIQEVIEAPAHLNGDHISMRLVQRLLNDLGDGLDQLPVLQHALHQIWNVAKQEEEALDLIHYAKVGGLAVNKLPKEDQSRFQEWFQELPAYKQELFEKPKLRNILNRHANELYQTAHIYYNERAQDKLSKEQAQFILKIAFTGLTKIDESRAVRNRITLQEITDILNRTEIDHNTVNYVLNIFREEGNTFVQPFISDQNPEDLPPNTVLDITHEALIRNWDRLIEWAEREYKSVQVFEDFKIQVNRWIESGYSAKYLLTVGTYNYFSEWYKNQQPTPAWILRYIRPDEMIPEMNPMEQATQYLEDIEEFLALSRQRIERNRRLVMAVIGLISLLFITSLIAAYWANEKRIEANEQRQLAVQNKRKAEQQREIARIQAREAQNQRIRAEREQLRSEFQAFIAENQRRIAESARDEAETQRLLAEREKRRAKYQAQMAEFNRIIAENQRQLAEERRQQAIESQREAEYEAYRAIQEKNNAQKLFSLFLAEKAEKQVREGNEDLGAKIARQALPNDLQNPDRPYMPEAEAALYLALNEKVNKDPVSKMMGHKNRIAFNRFSPDGTKLITTSWDKTARIWDTQSGNEVGVLRGHTHIVDEGLFSNDGKYSITLAKDFTARMWNLQQRREVTTFRGHKNLLTHATFSPDAQNVVTTSIDNTARLWEAQSGDLIATMYSHTDHVLYADYSPTGRYFVTTSKDFTARVWDAKDGSLHATLRGHNAPVNYAEFSPEGDKLVTVSDDHRAKIWDVQSGRELHTLVGHRDVVKHADFSSDGRRIATASADNTVKLWNARTGQVLSTLRGHSDVVYDVKFSPNDKRIASTAKDGTVRLWDGQSYLHLATYKRHPGKGYTASFSPSGKFLAFAEERSNTVKLYRVLPTKQQLLAASDSLSKGGLTQEQERRFFLDSPRLKDPMSKDQYMKERYEPIENRRKQQSNTSGPTSSSGKPAQEQQPAAIPGSGATAEEKASERLNTGGSREDGPAQYHVVQPGETLWRISQQHGLTVEELRQLNDLNSNNIRVGQKLRLR